MTTKEILEKDGFTVLEKGSLKLAKKAIQGTEYKFGYYAATETQLGSKELADEIKDAYNEKKAALGTNE